MIKKNASGKTLEQFMESYDASIYERPSLTTDAVIFTVDDDRRAEHDGKELQILLVKRRDHPCIGQWALPGGFLNIVEPLHKSAQRELGEETNVNVFMEQLKTFGDKVDRDPRDRVVSVAYMALIDKNSHQVIAEDDAEDAKWFSIYRSESVENDVSVDSWGHHTSHRITRYHFLSEDGLDQLSFDLEVSVAFKGYSNIETKVCVDEVLSGEALAFDHGEIIDYALTRLMGKLDYEPIALSMMPKAFTLKELMAVYEAIKNEPYQKKNFHRNILNKGFLKETGDLKPSGGKGKPAKLYTFDFNWNIWNRR